MDDYDQKVEKIQAYNQPILDEFEAWLAESWTKKTVKNHVDNIDFFADYLAYYEPLRHLDEASGEDVYSFLTSWFPRKALWASKSNQKSNLASFKKFFKWMQETGRISPEVAKEVLTTLKEEREEFLEAVDDDRGSWW